MNDKILTKIHSRGYWRINFQPLVDKQQISKLIECKEIVEKNSVQLRGWDYPHFPRRQGDDSMLAPGDNYYEGKVDWGCHKEFWRLYQSGQFIHHRGIELDWLGEDQWYSDKADKIKPGQNLGVIETTYLITEIFTFLSRLAQQGLYDEGINFSLSLNNIKGRQLYLDETFRVDFMMPRKTAAEKIEFNRTYSKDDVINKPQELAREAILYFFERFDWDNPPIETIKQDQENLLNRRM